jgi:hypothetical protein
VRSQEAERNAAIKSAEKAAIMIQLAGHLYRFRRVTEKFTKSVLPPIFRWFCVGNLIAVGLLAQCTQDSQTHTSGTFSLLASNCITATSTISGSASVAYEAGSSITLQPGFTATAGSAGTTFLAIITPVLLSVTTTSLPAGTVNTAYSQTLNAAGGSPPYGWSLATGSLPSGLSLNSSTGVISGTPQSYTGSPFSFSVTVYDSAGAASPPQSLSISIVAPPSISSVTPTSGAAGVQVTILGSGFGAARGTGVVWLGTNPGAVLSWSDTQIVATVASNATSGSVLVQQNGASSNSIPFTVNTVTISSVTPTSGLPGTEVTITGSGFGSVQGTGQVWLGTANGVVQSWSDGQVVAVVASGSATGQAQILQNGVFSNAVAFVVNTPHITGVSPASGAPGTSVTITGTGFGSVQGTGTIALGSTGGQVVSWSDTQVVAAVAPTALTGIVRIQQNAAASNALSFTVTTTGSGNGLTLAPNLFNMAVGDTHTIQALSAAGQPVTGLTWTSSDATIVSLSTDDPPLLTAVAAGHVTITAGTASADVTVWPGALPLGTVLWSNPGDGSGVFRIIPAVPSASGVADVFALQNDGTVQAITSDGTVAWSYNIPDAVLNTPLQLPWSLVTIIPDFQGGIIVVDYVGNGGPGSIQRVDGITGQPYPAYDFDPAAPLYTTGLPLPPPVVHTDGTVFAIQTEQSNEWRGSVVGIDPATGAQKFKVPVPIPQPDFYCGYSGTSYDASSAGATGLPNIVAGDGNYYFAYAYNEYSNCLSGPTHLRLLQVNSSGASQLFTILDANPPSPFGSRSAGLSLGLISNADVGVVLTWSLTFGANQDLTTQFGMAITTGASVNVLSGPSVPGQQTSHADDGSATGLNPVVPILQREDGSFIGSVLFQTNPQQINMVAFDASGNVLWSVPNEQPQIATADGGVIGQSGITYDANGNATGQVNPVTQSWTGDLYQDGPVTQVAGTPTLLAASYWVFQGGNQSANKTAVKQGFFLTGPTNTSPTFYNGQPLIACSGVSQSTTFYGYQVCAKYQLFSNANPSTPLNLALPLNELIYREATNAGPRQPSTGGASTDSQGVLTDELLLGGNNASFVLSSGQFVLYRQNISTLNGSTVRINCLDYESTGVTVTDITATPYKFCARH